MAPPSSLLTQTHQKITTKHQGPKGKMSASVETSAIYVTDTHKKIKTKIGRAFSGGQVRACVRESVSSSFSLSIL